MKKRSLDKHVGLYPAEKRAAPKHFHHTLSSISVPQVTQAEVVKPRVELNRHCFGSALDFLGPEFLAAAHSCKEWYALASMCVPRREFYRLNHGTAEQSLRNLSESPLRHHISRLDTTNIDSKKFAPMLALITTKLPHVVELSCHLNASSNPFDYIWPSRLTSLAFRLDNALGSLGYDAYVRRIVQSCPSLESFTLYNVAPPMKPSCITLLKQLPKLTHLSIHSTIESDGASVIRGLPHLKRLYLRNIDSMLLELSAQDDATKERALPQIEELMSEIAIDTVNVQYLIRFNTLTKLNCAFINADVAEQTLKFLPNLVDLTMDHCDDEGNTDEQGLEEQRGEVRALRFCPQLRELTLYQKVDSSDLVSALVHIHNLERLGISMNNMLSSLKFMSVVKSTVKGVWLYNCRSIPVTDFGYIRQMHQLERLSIDDSFCDRFDDFTIATASPHDQWFDKHTWPNLNVFTYSYSAD